jgi:hypothetical protein
MSTHLTRSLLEASLALTAPTARQAAASRLAELRSNKDWTKRYFAGDHDAQVEYDFLVWQMQHGTEPYCCPMPEAKSAADMRRDAELKFDGAIPAEVLAAIDAQQERECGR